jgi:2-dehydro-3-deoxygluconokinase
VKIPDSASQEVTTIGEAMAVLTPASHGALRDVRGFERGVGGAEANVAVALARLGHRAGWSGNLGNDELGAAVLEFLRAEGVDSSRVRLDPESPTGLYLKEFRARDALRVHYYRKDSAASRMTPESTDLDWLLSGQIVHLTGITPALSEGCDGLVRSIAAGANERGVEVCFDANVRHRLLGDRDAAEFLGPFVQMADLIFLSEDEAALLLDARGPEEVAEVKKRLRAHTVVVHGADGAFAVSTRPGASEASEETRVVEDSTDPVTVVDPVGAGDAFVGGFLAGRLRGLDVKRCLRLANACGGCAASLPGDAESMPYAEDVADALGGETRSER